MPLPVVAIVGRVNVGKSTLFNRMLGRDRAIHDATPSVTRDRSGALCELAGRTVQLVDTGGIGNDADPYAAGVQRQVDAALSEAAVVIFLVDARAGCLPLDATFARRLRETSCPIVFAANKADGPEGEEGGGRADFSRLGFGDPLAVSATTGRNVPELSRRVAALLARSAKCEARSAEGVDGKVRSVRIAVLGRPNVGKSTWVNAVFGAERMLVDARPGTTRDAVDVTVVREKRAWTLVDTAGFRKVRAVQGSVDFYAQHRAVRAARSADCALLLIDATSEVSRVDKQLAALLAAEFKPWVLVVNKWDLAPPESGQAYLRYLADRLPESRAAPVAFTSGAHSRGLWEALETAWELSRRARLWVGAERLADLVEAAVRKNPPRARAGRARTPAVGAVRQVDVAPIRIRIETNDPSLWKPADRAMLVSAIRAGTPWGEIPIRIDWVRAESRPPPRHSLRSVSNRRFARRRRWV